MLTNHPRVPHGRLPWLAAALALSACGSAETDSPANGGTAGPASAASDGSGVEPVAETPSATDEDTEVGATSPGGDPGTSGDSPENVGGIPENVGDAPFDGAGGPPDGDGGSAGEASGAPESGNDGETTNGGDTEAEPAVEPPACGIAHPGGVANHALTSGGREREYRLFVPDSYDGQTRLPVMFNLHGTGGNAAGQAEDSGMERLAQQEGFIVIGLQGFNNRWNVLLNDPNDVDDVQYASDVLDDAMQNVCVDERRVYATGFSGGARMTSRLACNLGERIAAIAPVSGIRWTAPCSGRAVPVVTFHGLADPQNTYAGMARDDEWVESVEDALAGWATHNGCDEARNETPEVNGVSVYSYGNCEDGADVVLHRIAGLGHTWAKNEIDATREMWTFLKDRTMP